jgi:parallel beta-helix repeat protein
VLAVMTSAALTSGCSSGTPVSPVLSGGTCLPSGDDTTINTALSRGGTVMLCRDAVFDLNAAVVFTRNNQRLYTEGFPTDSRRALLRVASPTLATAISFNGRSNAHVSHLIIDGNRTVLGRLPAGDALIMAGGDATGQRIEHVRAFEPRGWSGVHAFEGVNRGCAGITIAHNEIGPAGHANEEWADGISLACRRSLVHTNTITDATDAGIVIFGSPGSIVAGNTIRAVTRSMLGGINMVDFHAFGGDFTQTVVDANVIEGAGRPIRIGLAMGTRTWTCLPSAPKLSGGIVSHNVLQGQIGYGYAVNGVTNWIVMDNVSHARHVGSPALDCAGRVPSAPGAFQIARANSSGTFQSEFVDAELDSLVFAFGDPALQTSAR